MPAKDRYHDIVRRILEKEGWRITHDPYHIRVGRLDMFIDVGAEKWSSVLGLAWSAIPCHRYQTELLKRRNPVPWKITVFTLKVGLSASCTGSSG